MFYTVGEAAKQMGVSASTLRYYDKEGLLPFVGRSDGGIRLFKDSDFEWLRIIECLKKTGMQLADIRQFVEMAMRGDETIPERLDLIMKQKEAVIRQISELNETLETLEFKEWYYKTAQQAGSTSALENIKDEDLPERIRKTRKRLRGDSI